MMYWTDETNTFREGWASWDMTFDVETPYDPGPNDTKNVPVSDIAVTPASGGPKVTGNVTNSTGVAVYGAVQVYVALLDAQGDLVNVQTSTTDGTAGNLAPGASLPFDVEYWEGPTEYASYVDGAVASPASE